MRTAIGLWERTESASVERRFVPMADGQVCWCELAFLLTTQGKLYDRRTGALSSSGQKSRIATGRTRAQKPASAYVQVGSCIANARGRSRSRAHGRGNDTGGNRRSKPDTESYVRFGPDRGRCEFESNRAVSVGSNTIWDTSCQHDHRHTISSSYHRLPVLA
jgi:hypothetical protein